MLHLGDVYSHHFCYQLSALYFRGLVRAHHQLELHLDISMFFYPVKSSIILKQQNKVRPGSADCSDAGRSRPRSFA
jgi:hypothetical protein